MKTICIIGGGNIGTAIAGLLSVHKDIKVIVHTSGAKLWDNQLELIDTVSGCRSISGAIAATDDLEKAVYQADIVLITHPSFLRKDTLEKIAVYLKPKAWIGMAPGCGGSEYYAKDLIRKGFVFFCMERVPCVARIIEKGKSVSYSLKKQIRIAAIPQTSCEDVCKELNWLLPTECTPLKNYLTATLVPSNPILHTSRLYTIYRDIDINAEFKQAVLFYGEWTDQASEQLMACDSELQRICKRIGNLEVVPLSIHYESNSIEAMTKKIQSIQSWNKIPMPMKSEKGSYIVDTESRYFCEDVPYGLCIIRAIGELCGIESPRIDEMLKWYERVMHVEYFVDGEFCGKDLLRLPIPQNFGIDTLEKLRMFYQTGNHLN